MNVNFNIWSKTFMTKEENIEYLTLRSIECRLPENEIKLINENLKKLEDNDFDNLKRISEPEFRTWCSQVCSSK